MVVGRDPSLMVPPIIFGLISGIKTITGCDVDSLNSVLLAFLSPRAFRQYSITITCIPKHSPRYGFLFVRA
jgi:hypothetical protein